jgi:hypothetical protein
MDHNPTPKFAQQCLEICGVGKSTATNKKSGFLSELEAQFGRFLFSARRRYKLISHKRM